MLSLNTLRIQFLFVPREDNLTELPGEAETSVCLQYSEALCLLNGEGRITLIWLIWNYCEYFILTKLLERLTVWTYWFSLTGKRRWRCLGKIGRNRKNFMSWQRIRVLLSQWLCHPLFFFPFAFFFVLFLIKPAGLVFFSRTKARYVKRVLFPFSTPTHKSGL